MAKGLVGEKIGMTQVFNEQGHLIPVTVIQGGPCLVVDKKTKEKDGYNALVIGFGSVKKVNKPKAGTFKKNNLTPLRVLMEFRTDNIDQYEIGQEIKADIFKVGDLVDIGGISKGKGFAGTIKRWNFHRGPKTHGSKSYRIPGSLGSTDPARVFKGKKMAGRMGGRKVTIQNLKIVEVNSEENLLLIKGAVPGPKKSLVTICNAVKAG